jgi:putative DNA primase/helicase
MVPDPLLASNISPAVIFRIIEVRRPTLLIDEADTFIHGSDDMRGILNSGHSRSAAYVWRCDGDNHEPRGFSTWAPLAIAKIGKLPVTLESRSIEIGMRRRLRDEQIEPVGPEHRASLMQYRSMATRWAVDNAKQLSVAMPGIPTGIYNRARDNWKPLLAIADAAGGHWPSTARQVALQLSGCAEDPSFGVQLLADIRRVFEAVDTDRLRSEQLCAELGKMEDRPWCDYSDGFRITPRQLAKLLRPFQVRPDSVRIEDKTPKGYRVEDFADAFARYLPALPPANATPQQTKKFNGLDGIQTATQTATNGGESATGFADVADRGADVADHVAVSGAEKYNENNAVADVAVSGRQSPERPPASPIDLHALMTTMHPPYQPPRPGRRRRMGRPRRGGKPSEHE